jgi:hypothetical protein
MLIRFGLGILYLGRPGSVMTAPLDASVSLALWPRDAPPGEPTYHFIATAAWNWLPSRIYRAHGMADVTLSGAINSASWTGRYVTFERFGQWRKTFSLQRSTARSIMHVYLNGAKARSNAKHILYVCPASVVSANDCPAEWKDHDNQPVTFEVIFAHGRAEVPAQLGAWLLNTGQVSQSRLIRATGSSLLGSLAHAIAG